MQSVDIQVVIALRRASFTAKEVQSIYQSFPIGTPARGSAYVAHLIEDADRRIAQAEVEARRVRGLNFEVVKVVHVNGLHPAYLLTVRLQDSSEHIVSIAHAAVASVKAFRSACTRAGFIPELLPQHRGQGYRELAAKVTANAEESQEVDADTAVIGAIAAFLSETQEWAGSASELRCALHESLPRVPLAWPDSATALAIVLRRLWSELRARGIEVAFKRRAGGDRKRLIMLRADFRKAAGNERERTSSTKSSQATGQSSSRCT